MSDKDRGRARRLVAAASDDRGWRMLAAAPVGIFETDGSGGCTFVNPRWCVLAGMNPEDAIGSGWINAIHPDDRDRVSASWQAAVEAGDEFRLEYRFRRPDGSSIWLAGNATSVRQTDGSGPHYVGTVTDITDAVLARQELNDERRFGEAVLEIAGSLVCVIGPEGRFLRFNRACELLSGYSFEEIEGRPFYEFLLPEEEIEPVRELLGRLRAGDPPEPSVNYWITRSGARRLISWLDTCLFDDEGRLSHIISTGIDITEERRAEDALQGIEAIGTLLARTGPTPASLAAVLGTLSERMGYRYLALFLHDGEGLRLGAQLGYGELAAAFEPSRGVIGRVLRRGEASLVRDVSLDPDYVLASPDVTSEIAVPLIAEGQTLGVLSIASTLESPLGSSDLRLAQTVAERVSAAVLLGQNQQALADRARVFAALSEFARVVNSIRDTDRLHGALLEAINHVVPAETLSLTIIDRSTGRYIVRAVRGGIDSAAVGAEILPGEGATWRAIASHDLTVERLERHQYARALRDLIEADEPSCIVVPLVPDGMVLGTIFAARAPAPGVVFSELETEVLALLGSQAALALANAYLLAEVSELAIRDALTGLFNRRHFDATLDHILARRARSRQAQTPLAAIMFDLDHFGRFNEEHGHEAGDAVLRAFAEILLERFRSADLVARYGGEEFVAILEDATLEDAVRIADEIRAALHARVIQGHDGGGLRATVSAGCAALGADNPTRESLLRVADVALFMAKRAGRNKVVAA